MKFSLILILLVFSVLLSVVIVSAAYYKLTSCTPFCGGTVDNSQADANVIVSGTCAQECEDAAGSYSFNSSSSDANGNTVVWNKDNGYRDVVYHCDKLNLSKCDIHISIVPGGDPDYGPLFNKSGERLTWDDAQQVVMGEINSLEPAIIPGGWSDCSDCTADIEVNGTPQDPPRGDAADPIYTSDDLSGKAAVEVGGVVYEVDTYSSGSASPTIAETYCNCEEGIANREHLIDNLNVNLVTGTYAKVEDSINYVLLNSAFIINITYDKYSSCAKDYIQVWIKKSHTGEDFTLVKALVNATCSGTPDAPSKCQNVVLIDNQFVKTIDPGLCQAGGFEMKVVIASGVQDTSVDWEEEFSGGGWQNNKPSYLSPDNNEFNKDMSIESAVDLGFSELFGVQVTDKPNALVKDRDMIFKAKPTINFWPKEFWLHCDLPIPSIEVTAKAKLGEQADSTQTANLCYYAFINNPYSAPYSEKECVQLHPSWNAIEPSTLMNFIDEKYKPLTVGTDVETVVALDKILKMENKLFYLWDDSPFTGDSYEVFEPSYSTLFNNFEDFTVHFASGQIGNWFQRRIGFESGYNNKRAIEKFARETINNVKSILTIPEEKIIKSTSMDRPNFLTLEGYIEWGAQYRADKNKDIVVVVVPTEVMPKRFWSIRESVYTSDKAPGVFLVGDAGGGPYPPYTGLNNEQSENENINSLAEEMAGYISKYFKLPKSGTTEITPGWSNMWPMVLGDRSLYIPRGVVFAGCNEFYCNDGLLNAPMVSEAFLDSLQGIHMNGVEINALNEILEKGSWWMDPKTLFVQGVIYKDDIIELEPWYEYENGNVYNYTNTSAGNYSVEFLDSGDSVLDTINFEPNWIYGAQDIDLNFSTFAFELEYPTNTAKVRIKHNSIVLVEVNKSSNAPVVNSITATSDGDMLDINWSISDADGDELYSTLSYNCTGWYDSDLRGLALNINSSYTNYSLNTTDLAGGDSCKVQIEVTDIMDTTIAYSSSFSISNKAPDVWISYPENSSVFSNQSGDNYTYENISFYGWADDPELGDLDDINYTYKWSSDIDGDLSNQSSFETNNLSVGQHIITLNVSDGELSSINSIIINITDEIRPDLEILGLGVSDWGKPTVTDNVTLSAVLRDTIQDISQIDILFYDGDPNVNGVLIGNISGNYSVFSSANSFSSPNIIWNATDTTEGEHNIFVVIDDLSTPFCWETLEGNADYPECADYQCNWADINQDYEVNATDADLWYDSYETLGCVNRTYNYTSNTSICNEINTTNASVVCNYLNNSWCYGADVDKNGVLNLTDNSTLWDNMDRTDCEWPRLNESDTTNNKFNQTIRIYPELNDTHKFYIKGEWDYNVAWLGDSGNIVLAGGCYNITEINATNCTTSDSINEFVIQNSFGVPVAYIDQGGNICISQGDCDSLEFAATCNPIVDAFIVQNSAGTNMSYLDSNGGLCLKGALHEFADSDKLGN